MPKANPLLGDPFWAPRGWLRYGTGSTRNRTEQTDESIESVDFE